MLGLKRTGDIMAVCVRLDKIILSIRALSEVGGLDVQASHCDY